MTTIQLVEKWIIKERALRLEGEQHSANYRFKKAMLANTRASQLAKCRRELQEIEGMVVLNSPCIPPGPATIPVR